MLIPLWLPWAVVVSLALPYLLDELAATGAESGDGQGPPRTPRRSGGGDLWAWTASALLVAVVVAVSLTVDRVHVSDDELLDVVDRSAGEAAGTPALTVSDRLGVAVRERLGREVELETVDAGGDDEFENSVLYEVRLDGHTGGPVVCLEVDTVDDLVSYPGVDTGGCDD